MPAVIAVSMCAGGCWGNFSSDFPPGLAPLEENRAALPAPRGDGELPEAYNTLCDRSGYYWCHMRGYVRAPLDAVWAALQRPEVVVTRHRVTSVSAELETDLEYEHSFTFHYFVDNIVNVEWDEMWRFGLLELEEGEPVGAVRSQKIWGTTFIDLVERSIVVREVPGTGGVTEIEAIEHLDAADVSTETILDWMEDTFTNAAAGARGEPVAPL